MPAYFNTSFGESSTYVGNVSTLPKPRDNIPLMHCVERCAPRHACMIHKYTAPHPDGHPYYYHRVYSGYYDHEPVCCAIQHCE